MQLWVRLVGHTFLKKDIYIYILKGQQRERPCDRVAKASFFSPHDKNRAIHLSEGEHDGGVWWNIHEEEELRAVIELEKC